MSNIEREEKNFNIQHSCANIRILTIRYANGLMKSKGRLAPFSLTFESWTPFSRLIREELN